MKYIQSKETINFAVTSKVSGKTVEGATITVAEVEGLGIYKVSVAFADESKATSALKDLDPKTYIEGNYVVLDLTGDASVVPADTTFSKVGNVASIAAAATGVANVALNAIMLKKH